MAARVVFTSGFSRRYTGGVREFTVEAKNLHGVIKAMDRLYPRPRRTPRRRNHRRNRRRHPRNRLFPADPRRLRNLLHPQTRRGLTSPLPLRASSALQLITTGLSEVGASVSLEVLARPKRFSHKARVRFRIRPAPRHQLGRDHRCFVASTAI